MKYNLFFVVMSNFCIVVQSSYAMENKNSTLEIIKKLTAIKPTAVDVLKYFHAVEYVTNESVVIGHRDGCSILDIKNDKEIKKISDVSCYKLAVHPNQKKIAFSADTTIKLYDIETSEQEWSSSEEHYTRSIFFNVCNDTIFLCLEPHARCNYSGDRCDNINPPDIDVALCSEKQIMCTVKTFDGVVSLYNASNLTLKPKKIELIWDCNPSSASVGNRCCISSEGIIAVGEVGKNFIHIITNATTDAHKITYLKGGIGERFLRMLFYPRGSVLATISEIAFDKKMRYWDVKTRKPIWTAAFPSYFYRDNPFAFSPNGKEVIFAFSNECVICQVPFEVMNGKCDI